MTQNFDVAWQYLQNLDLSYVVRSMCAPQYPLPRWVKEEAETCCRLYKNFLFLQKKHEDEALVPTREIDEFWHNHILYTKHYVEDCQAIFGRYLHHFPASEDEDKKKLVDDFLRTKDLYLAEFGEPLILQRSRLPNFKHTL